MRVSIVVPSYNHAAYIEECLDSLFVQREQGVDVEVLLMDGGSDDGTREIIKRNANRLTIGYPNRTAVRLMLS